MPKFQFYEIVRVVGDAPDLEEIRGERGAILGMSDGEDGAVSYAVLIFRDDECWSIDEGDLESTGERKSREDFYDDSQAIKVRVDEEGRGLPVEPPSDER